MRWLALAINFTILLEVTLLHNVHVFQALPFYNPMEVKSLSSGIHIYVHVYKNCVVGFVKCLFTWRSWNKFTGGANLQTIVKACKVLLKFALLELEKKRDSNEPLVKVHWR